jgi:hypothetical protein
MILTYVWNLKEVNFLIILVKPGVLVNACNPSTWEAGEGRIISLRSDWAT